MAELPEGRVVRYADKEFNFSFAATIMEMLKGLGGVESVAPFDGMIFDFSSDTNVIMTPRGLLFPIDIAFIRSDGVVEAIRRMDPALNQNVYASSKVRYVIEAPVNFFQNNGIVIGSKLSI